MSIVHGGARVNGEKTVKETKTYGVGKDGKPNSAANPEMKVVDHNGKVEWLRSKDVHTN